MDNPKPGNRKSIFITGAASGMGRATACLFARKEWFVGAFDVNTEGLNTLQEQLGSKNCFIRRLDVTDKPDYDVAVSEFGARTGGRMDILYNNAGTGEGGWFEDIPYEASMRIVNINLIGVLNGIYAGLPLLKATPNSLCFTTSSSSATFGMPTIAVYSATKHAVKGLTEALSIEFSRLGIRAADVLPAAIDTPLLFNTPRHSKDLPDHMEPAKKGMFRLLPADEAAKCVWKAYHGTKVHYYVPPELAWLDRLKGLSPEMLRNRMKKMLLKPLSRETFQDGGASADSGSEL
jgi:NAD(P)-dependent dehydrogenase (short-subunit alcohol dehydrogenase family)